MSINRPFNPNSAKGRNLLLVCTKSFRPLSCNAAVYLTDMIWYSSDTSPQLLLVVHSPNIVTLWNTQTGTKVWRVVYEQERQRETELFLQIIQDPFNHQRAIRMADCR
jgi:hypothetical protein